MLRRPLKIVQTLGGLHSKDDARSLAPTQPGVLEKIAYHAKLSAALPVGSWCGGHALLEGFLEVALVAKAQRVGHVG